MPDLIAGFLPEGVGVSGLAALVDYGGALVMLLLLGLSIAAMTVLVYKVVQFTWHSVGWNHERSQQAIRLWSNGQAAEALQALSAYKSGRPSVFAAVIGRLSNDGRNPHSEDQAEKDAQKHLSALRGNLRVLESAAQLAPLIGLFGTVIGMMGAFQELQAAGADTDPAALAGGIWVALMTTAAGLAIAIPASFALYWLDGRLQREQELLEAGLTDIFAAADRQPSEPQAVMGSAYAAE
ncbi:MAG: MotA/TolQ/ExbB proton channel family protein [Pseudomonadota bacterium]